MYRSQLIRPLIAAMLAVGIAGPVPSQVPVAPNPYNPYGPTYITGPGATLSGGAQVMQATGDLWIQGEKSRQERQKYYQDKITTKKMAFDEAQYEKANTPSWTEEQEKIMGLQIRRIMNQANPAEIKRGETLNMLMPYIKALADQGVPGPPLPINPTMLRSVNVKTGTAGASPSAGLLKDGGKLSWPLMLRGPTQKELDKLLPQAISGAVNGTLEPAQYTKIVSDVQSMQEEVRKKYHKEQINGSTYLSSKAYLDSLESSLKVLQQPDAARYFDGSFGVQGSNVPELVDNMMAQGLTFAPATPGNDAPYFSLHNAFVSYARAAQSGGGGFQSRGAPSPTSFGKKGAGF
jgi:hypothetical protein